MDDPAVALVRKHRVTPEMLRHACGWSMTPPELEALMAELLDAASIVESIPHE